MAQLILEGEGKKLKALQKELRLKLKYMGIDVKRAPRATKQKTEDKQDKEFKTK